MKQTQQNRTGLVVAILVVLGLMAGAGLGLLLGWVVWPVNYFDTAIADLRTDHKEQYIVLVASAYTLDGDLEKAEARLAELEAPNINQWIAQLTDRYITEEQNEADIQMLVELAHALGVDSPQMAAWLRPSATPTPPPTDTPPPSPSPALTDTPTPTSIPASDTPAPPSDTPQPQASDTSVPQPTDTPIPPTNTPKPTSPPQPTNTPKPPTPTNTPKPAAPRWTSNARLLGPVDHCGQECEAGNLMIRVTVVDANGSQIGGVWIYDRYSQQYQVTGNVGSPDYGPGETKFEYGIGGGGSLCVANGQGGACVSDFTRDMRCYHLPDVEDLFPAGYCECCEVGASLERCRQLINEGKCFQTGAGHFSWHVVFKRSG